MKTRITTQIIILISSILMVSSCTEIKQQAYNRGYAAGYSKGKEDCQQENRLKDLREKQNKASSYTTEDVKRDISYYFELYHPEEKIKPSTLKIRKIGTNLYNIQLMSTSEYAFDNRKYNEYKYILHLTYNPLSEKFSVEEIGGGHKIKYKGY